MGERGFKFEASWLEQERCAEVVEDAWKRAMELTNVSAHDALKVVAASLAVGAITCWETWRGGLKNQKGVRGV
jgi:uncharacterized membrane protein